MPAGVLKERLTWELGLDEGAPLRAAGFDCSVLFLLKGGPLSRLPVVSPKCITIIGHTRYRYPKLISL